MSDLQKTDFEIYKAIILEAYRQHSKLELIASENFVSLAVLEAMGSVMTNKYAEGYPKKRYYGGCEYVDIAEELAVERAKELFGAEYVNVQPHSGAQANQAAYMAFLKPGDKVFGLDLACGGHLSHGSKINFSGLYFNFIPYFVAQETEVIDYDDLMRKAKEELPKMIVAGASAYPRMLHFDKFAEICKEVGAYLMVDIAHIAGLIVAGLHPSPMPYADVVTTTTHKTLRGPRGGMVMAPAKYEKELARAVFPGAQGGPLMHIIAAKAVAFKEALQPEFKEYQKQIVRNASALAERLKSEGLRIVSGGTDTHLMLADVKSVGITGREAEKRLDEVNITVNKNTIPFETEKPMVASGIRVGTPAVTTRGMKEAEMVEIAKLIKETLLSDFTGDLKDRIRGRVRELTEAFPLYKALYQDHLVGTAISWDS